MIWIILAALGVPLWLVAGALGTSQPVETRAS
jgi:hypothetical protein